MPSHPTNNFPDTRDALVGHNLRVWKTDTMQTITKIDLCPEEKQKIQPYPSNQQVSRLTGYLYYRADLSIDHG